MSTGQVIVSRLAAVVELRISNATKRNAMSLEMWLSFARTVRSLYDDPEVRVLLIRGDGDEAFISGADITEFDLLRSPEAGSSAYDEAVENAQQSLLQCPFPVVACIHGVCIGGGLGLAMACDLRYASRTARFRMPAARLGLGYGIAGIQRMVEILGSSWTANIFMTARQFDGIEAERIGVVHAIYPDHELDAAVAEIVRSVAENAPLTLRLVKTAIRLTPIPAGAKLAEETILAQQACIQSADYREGRRAFAEKRQPNFTGS
jgi:enoyl-CoA hydratase/carnithine racemase